MKRAVLPSPGGNLEALEAVLRDIDSRGDRGAPVDEILCLGGLFGSGPDPLPCLELVKRRCARVLLGSVERRVLEKIRKPLQPVDADREAILRAVHALLGSDAPPGTEDTATIDLVGRVMAPDYEQKLAEDAARKAAHATELRIPLAERLAGGESALTQELLKRMLVHPGIRGLVLQFMHRSRIRREADDMLRWLGSLPVSLRMDLGRLVADNPFTPGDGRPLLDAPADPAKPFLPVSKLFSDLEWGATTALFFGASSAAALHRDTRRPGLVAATPGSAVPGAPEAAWLLWDGSSIEIVRVPVGAAARTLEKMDAAGIPRPA